MVKMEPKVAKVSPKAPPMVPKLVQSRPNCHSGCLCGAKVWPKSPPWVPKRRRRSPQAPPASPKCAKPSQEALIFLTPPASPVESLREGPERAETHNHPKPALRAPISLFDGGYPNWLIKEWGNYQSQESPKAPQSAKPSQNLRHHKSNL